MAPQHIVWPELAYFGHRLMVLEASMGDLGEFDENLRDDGFRAALYRAFDQVADAAGEYTGTGPRMEDFLR